MEPLLMTLLLYTAIILLLGAFFFLLFWLRPYPVDRSVPGPKRHWLLGVTFGDSSELSIPGESFDWSRWPTLSVILSQQYHYQTWGGPTINLGFGGAFFNIVTPECLQHILRDNFENYPKGKLCRSFRELFGRQSPFVLDGDMWKFHRKIAVSILNKETIKIGAQILLQDKLTQVERILLEKNDEVVFDFQDFCNRLILDVFCQLGFGVELNSLEKSNNNNDDDAKYVDFVQAMDELQYLIHLRFNDLLWEIKQRFGIGKRERRVKELNGMIDKFAYDIIEAIKDNNNKAKLEEASATTSDATEKGNKHSSSSSNNGTAQRRLRQDIVSRYLEFCEREKQPTPNNRELRDLVVGFLMAGRDTTAASLTWTMYELIKHPVVVDRIREELHQVCGDKKSNNNNNNKQQQQQQPHHPPLTLELIQDLPFLHCVVMEALRLHPAAPENFRFAARDDVLPDGTRIPAGSLVMYSINTINHNASVWYNPDEFIPDRFINNKEPSPFQFATFNGGPRSCPGRGLALMEIKLILAFLIQRFDFEDVDKHDGDYRWTLVMAMKNGFKVRARRRCSS